MAILDSAGVPVVGGVDALLVVISTTQPQQAYLAAALAVFGSLLGSLFLFFLARKGGEMLLAKYISTGAGAKMHRWFERYGLITVFLPALSPVPLPMKIPVFCAGALRVKVSYFVGVVALARVIRYFALAYLGQTYGLEAGKLMKAHAWEIGLGALAVAALVTISTRLFQNFVALPGRQQ